MACETNPCGAELAASSFAADRGFAFAVVADAVRRALTYNAYGSVVRDGAVIAGSGRSACGGLSARVAVVGAGSAASAASVGPARFADAGGFALFALSAGVANQISFALSAASAAAVASADFAGAVGRAIYALTR